MMPWEVVINTPEDLFILADVMHDWNHPGEEIVRYLIKQKKFPRSAIHFRYPGKYHCWVVGSFAVSRMGNGDFRKQDHVLPKKAFYMTGNYQFFSITEAIWAVINAGRYKPRTKDNERS